ncbi:hypothetical protein KC349_g2997 [Hortaea werneckii]|nr:hypothetical protein KC349_g2997 [Hortaea werneckii]
MDGNTIADGVFALLGKALTLSVSSSKFCLDLAQGVYNSLDLKLGQQCAENHKIIIASLAIVDTLLLIWILFSVLAALLSILRCRWVWMTISGIIVAALPQRNSLAQRYLSSISLAILDTFGLPHEAPGDLVSSFVNTARIQKTLGDRAIAVYGNFATAIGRRCGENHIPLIVMLTAGAIDLCIMAVMLKLCGRLRLTTRFLCCFGLLLMTILNAFLVTIAYQHLTTMASLATYSG